MKFAVGILALCLVATHAAVVQPPTNYEVQVEGIVNELVEIAVQTAQTLEQQYEEIVLDPNQQVEAALQGIDQRKAEHEGCVVAQEEHVDAIVNAMHDEMNQCGVVAAKTSADIMVDVNQATQQLIFDGYDVLTTYNKCRNYKNSVLKNSCYARLSIKATLYMKNATKSIKTINESRNERIPGVFIDADACTHSASDRALEQLEVVNANIDECARM